MLLTEPLQSFRQLPCTQFRAAAHDQSRGFAPSVGVDYLNPLPSVDCHYLSARSLGITHWGVTPVYPGKNILWIQYATVNLGRSFFVLRQKKRDSKPMKIMPFLEQHS